MDCRNLVMGIIFLIENTVGILGNVSFLSYYIAPYYKKHKLKPLDLILMHLIIVNFLIIVSKGMGNTLTAFKLKHLFDDWSYQLFMFVLRVFRSMSIATLCILSIFQATLIYPRNSCWKNTKDKSLKVIGLYISIGWVFYILINAIFPLYLTMNIHRNITKEIDIKQYTVIGHDKITVSIYIAFFVFPELLFSVLIIWSSISMIIILYRHKQHIQHIRSTHTYHSSYPELRATQKILVLLFTFLAIYTLSAILHGYNALLHDNNLWLIDITIAITLCFPTLSPFVLMSQTSTFSRHCFH